MLLILFKYIIFRFFDIVSSFRIWYIFNDIASNRSIFVNISILGGIYVMNACKNFRSFFF